MEKNIQINSSQGLRSLCRACTSVILTSQQPNVESCMVQILPIESETKLSTNSTSIFDGEGFENVIPLRQISSNNDGYLSQAPTVNSVIP
jgi:hypothetical protein